MHENELLVPRCKIDMFLEDHQFVAAVFVQADFTNAQNVGPIEELGYQRHDLAGKFRILRLLWIDAQPREMPDAERGGARRFKFRELTKIVVEALWTAAVVAGPERRLCDGHTPRQRHAVVVIGGPRDHMNVGVNVGQ